MRKKFVTILMMCGSNKEAGTITDVLLRKRMISCANILSGAESRFWWKGRIESARETLVIMKTVSANFSKVEREVRRLHSYDVPEVVALPISEGSAPYMRWLEDTAA